MKNLEALRGYAVTHFQPFDPVHKRTEAEVRSPHGHTFKVTKGAPHFILALAENKSVIQATVEKAVGEFAGRGFRSLGVARTDDGGKVAISGRVRSSFESLSLENTKGRHLPALQTSDL